MTTHTLEVWGDLACFTRPEMKVERFSYPVITPSAARGIFDAIYWDGKREQRGKESVMRPYFYWQVTRIEVLEPPRYIALRRNEVKDRVPGTADPQHAGCRVPPTPSPFGPTAARTSSAPTRRAAPNARPWP